MLDTEVVDVAEHGLLDADEWRSLDDALDSSVEPKDVDWKTHASDLTTCEVLKRLAYIKAILPEDNIGTKKDQHNITLENYMKLALEAAGTTGNLELFLKILTAKMGSDSCTPLLAQQALLIWGPIAEISGWYSIKNTLEEEAFKTLYPEENEAILQAYEHLGGDTELEQLTKEYEEAIRVVVEDDLQEGLTCAVSARKKSAYSVWRKCQSRGRTNYALPDFFGVRVVIAADPESLNEDNLVEACYGLATLISQYFEPELDRYKDYVSRPKPNGYQSLHMTLRDINGARLEVQVRTASMHNRAENDPDTSHMAYEATSKVTPGKYFMGHLRKPHSIYAWRNVAAKTIHERSRNADDSLSSLRGENLLVFSRKGNLYEFTPGCTALDFAFASHSDLALNTRAIQVNGVQVAYDTVLRHGDMVRVLYSQDGKTTWNEGWLKKVNSKKARDRINRATKLRDELPLIKRGVALVLEKCRTDLPETGGADLLGALSEKDMEDIAISYGLESFAKVLREIGNGTTGVRAGRIARIIGIRLNEQQSFASTDGVVSVGGIAIQTERRVDNGEQRVAILGTMGCNYHIAGCCVEFTSENIVATTCPSRGDFAVHNESCVNVGNKKVLVAQWY